MTLLRRLRDERGYSLIELIMVCTLLSIVLGAVTIIMVSGSRVQVDLNFRFQAQTSARIALNEFRGDAHNACAAVVNAGQTVMTFSIPLLDRSTTPATQPVSTTQCGGGNGNNLKKVIWCVLAMPTNAAKFALYRSITSTCTTSSKIEADNGQHADRLHHWFSAQPTTIATHQNRRVISIDIPVTLKSGVNGKAFDLKQWITPVTVWR